MRPPALFLVLFLVLAPTAAAQTAPPAPTPQASPTPPRDNQSQEKTGTARLSGRVTAGDTGKPLRRALVRATPTDNPQPQPRSVSTDAEGHWELKSLPAGSYRIRVEKGGYVAIFYGQQRPFAQGKVVDVSDGQTVEKLDVALPRAGVITGVIFDEFGEPMTGARVSAMRYGYMNGQKRLMPLGTSAVTDDIGQYRLHGLTPGEYVISASTQTAIILGASDDRMGYAPTFYPGTAVSTDAQRVRVSEAQEVQQITFNMVATRVATISGTAVNASGKPINRGFISVSSFSESGGPMGFGTQLKPDGSFQFTNVAAGEYRIAVQYSPSADDNVMIGPGSFAGTEYASVAVTVAGRDVTVVSLVTATGGSARGRITFEGGMPPSVSPAPLMVSAPPTTAQLTPMMMGGGSARVRDDWTFEVSGLFDRRRFRIASAPPGWYLKSVSYEGADVIDSGIDFTQGAKVGNVDLVLTQHMPTISGSVLDARDKPASEYVVVAFAADSSKWGYQTRFVRTARPNQEGRFSLSGLPPEEYFVVALDYIEAGEETDAEQLEKWKSLATRVTLSEGETKPLNLKLASQLP